MVRGGGGEVSVGEALVAGGSMEGFVNVMVVSVEGRALDKEGVECSLVIGDANVSIDYRRKWYNSPCLGHCPRKCMRSKF